MQEPLTLLVFSATLVVSTLLTGVFKRTILSNAPLFTLIGFLCGIAGLARFEPGSESSSLVVRLALITVLFTDSMNIDLNAWRDIRTLPRRALLVGMPLTFAIITLLTHVIFRLGWLESMLVGAILSPTDPVLASDIVEQDDVPGSVRLLLNIESGLNDGLVLPVVIILLEIASAERLEPLRLLVEVIGGVLVGIVLPWIVHQLVQRPPFHVEVEARPLSVLAVGLLVITVSAVIGVNEFLAAFTAGVVLGNLAPAVRDGFQPFGKTISELLKLAALFVFGTLLSPALFTVNAGAHYLFAVLVLVLARPLSIVIALIGASLSPLEKLTVAWFGPKGFSSILYLLLAWRAGVFHSANLFGIVAVTLVLSILAHSSTGILFAQRFKAGTETTPH